MISEQIVQEALYKYLRARNVWPIFPNIDCITGYEADILAITKAGYSVEYEIKLTISDFRADKKKLHKHSSLSGNVKEVQNPYSEWEGTEKAYVLPGTPMTDLYSLRERCYPELRPKKFWYVINGFDVQEKEIPDYAGLMRFIQFGPFEIIKAAPSLDALPVDKKRIEHAKMNMLFRYWNTRLGRNGKAGDLL